jgi:hypothetical protein
LEFWCRFFRLDVRLPVEISKHGHHEDALRDDHVRGDLGVFAVWFEEQLAVDEEEEDELEL